MSQHHSYDRLTRRHIGPCPLSAAIIDPVNKAAEPFNTLPFAPEREAGKNEVILVNATFTDWEYVADYTGMVYSKASGEPVTHEKLCELPGYLTTLQPTSPWDEWDEQGNTWQTNTQARQMDLCQRYCTTLDSLASTVRQRFISGAGDVIAEYQLAEKEATAYKADGYQGDVPESVQIHADAYQVTAQQATDEILVMADQMKTALTAIRRFRLNGKQAIKALGVESDEAAFKAEFDNWYQQLDAIKPAG